MPVMQRLVVSAVLMCLAVVLGGCGGASVDEGDPVQVAQVAAEAWLRSDVDGLIEVSCKKMREQLEASREEMKQMAEMMNAMGVDMKDIRFDFTDVTFEAEEVGDYTARIRMKGPLKVSIPGRADELRDQDVALEMVNEEGDWKLCSEIN